MPAPDKHDPSTFGERTWAVRGGNAPDALGALRLPLVLANSYALPEDASQVNWSDPDDLIADIRAALDTALPA